jgi:predicted AlkP superfamily phosphohydrolase/phosphomutase
VRRALVAVSLAWLCLACRAPAPARPTTDVRHVPILVVAVDGLEWNVVLPLLRRGRLPEIASLMHRGTFGKLQTMKPTESPVIWTSIATGKRAREHGIKGFLRSRNPPVLYTNADRTTKALWNILTERDKSVRIIGWWMTYPVEPVNGIMVAQANSSTLITQRGFYKGSLVPGVKDQVYPPELEAEVFETVAGMERSLEQRIAHLTGGAAQDASPEARKALEESRWALRADASYEQIALQLAEHQGVPDFTAVYFGSCDVVAHRFWKYAGSGGVLGWAWGGFLGRTVAPAVEAEHVPGKWLESLADRAFWSYLEPRERDGWRGILLRTYEDVDEAIGRLVRAYPPETTVLVVSDHGARPWGHDDAPPALLIAAGPNIRTAAAEPLNQLQRSQIPLLGSIFDITPTLLLLAGVPAAKDMEGHVLDALLLPDEPLRQRPAPLETYDTREWLAARRERFANRPPDTDLERLEQLRALGYIQ